jgi:transposase
MLIIGCDFHPGWQQVAWLDLETGDTGEAQLEHSNGEAERWYRQLAGPSLIGLEATGNCDWFVELLQKLGHEVWIGDAAKIRASYVRKQKNDRRDAQHLLTLLREGRFPRLWRPTAEQRDVRQLLIHRHKLVEMRTRVKNALQHLAMNRGMQKKRQLWSQAGQKAFRQLALVGWAGCRRADLLELLAYLDGKIAPLDRAVEERSQLDEVACLLRTQPGVGPITALAFAVTIGEATRFQRGKQVASYLGLIPREHSSGGKQRLGGISKQGNRFLRQLLVEAAQSAVRGDESMRRPYLHRCHSKPKGVAKVAAARKLAVRLYWMMRTQTAYPEIVGIESSPRVARVGRGSD